MECVEKAFVLAPSPRRRDDQRKKMRRTYFFCVCAVMFAAFVSAGQQAHTRSSPPRKSHVVNQKKLPDEKPLRLSSTVVAVCSIVEATDWHPLGFARGSGFFLTRKYLLTCNHLLSVPSPYGPIPADRIVVEFVDGRKCTAKIVATEKYHDLALLEVHRCRATVIPATLGDFSLSYHDRVRIAGLFDPSGFWVTEGRVTALNILDGLAMADAKVRSGFSGAPVFDREGKVQGILTQRDDARNAIFVRSDVILGFLQAAGIPVVHEDSDNGVGIPKENTQRR
jgi:S1-C subfamily serine protease